MRRANDTAIAQSFVINKEMYNLKNNSDELDKLAKNITKALPSQQNIYQRALAYVNKRKNLNFLKFYPLYPLIC